jgi:integrase
MSATFSPLLDESRPFMRTRLDSGTYYCTRKPRPFSLGTKDRKEAEVEYDRKIGQERPSKGDVRNQQAFSDWIEKKKKKLEQTTIDLYEGVWKLYCKDVIGGKLVQEVKKEHIQRIYKQAEQRESAKTGEPISEARRKHIDVCLSSYFNSMTREPTHYRDDNPVEKLGDERPVGSISGNVSEDEVLSAEEVEHLAAIAAVVSHPNRFDEVLMARQLELLIYVLAYGGMRLGEALALELDDLRDDEEHGEWFIWKKLAEKRNLDDPTTWFGKLKGKPGKIGDRVRYVPIMNAWLRERIDGYVAEGLKDGWLKPGGLLFPTTKGKPRTVSGIDGRFERVRDAAGFGAEDRGMATVLHHLRHTFASWLLESGEYDIEGIALLIGDTVKVCNDRYAHLGSRTKQNAKARKAMAVRHGAAVVPAPEPAAPAASNVVQVDFRRAS